jgi:K+-transporting ATPase ATPase C chain
MTRSGSGPDPDASPANARLQAGRIANTRSVATVQVQIDGRIQPAVLGFIGEPRVNVLAINRALDARFPLAQPGTL